MGGGGIDRVAVYRPPVAELSDSRIRNGRNAADRVDMAGGPFLQSVERAGKQAAPATVACAACRVSNRVSIASP